VPALHPEGWSLGIQAALGSGVPVLSSRHVHAARDLVRDGCNGTIVGSDEPDSWADAIGDLTDTAVRDARSEAAMAVSRAFAPPHASAWLLGLLDDAEGARRTDGHRLSSRSFVDHAWSTLVPDKHRPPSAP
jgi:glycosyltransferase involved in cell wall biosynthesis